MPRTKIGSAQPDRKTLDLEIAHLRELDVAALRARWHTVSGGDRRLIWPDTCCFGFWLTGSKRIF
jgi:hypothetical protein